MKQWETLEQVMAFLLASFLCTQEEAIDAGSERAGLPDSASVYMPLEEEKWRRWGTEGGKTSSC